MTFYNTTQRVKIEGRGYVDFGNKFIIPLFRDKIATVPPGKIEQYNKDVIAALSGKRKVVSRPVRSVRYKSTSKLPCTKCEITFLNNSQLNKHKKIIHVNDGNNLESSIKCLPLVEDLSLVDLTDSEINDEVSDEVTVEETCTIPKSNCVVSAESMEEKSEEQYFKCEKCEYNTLNKTDLERHMNTKHVDECVVEAEKPLQLASTLGSIVDFCCRKCEFKTEDPQQLINHKLVKIFHCEKCDFETSEEQDLKTHVKSVHECGRCGYKTDDETEMKMHFQTTHKSVRVSLVNQKKFNKIKCEQCEYECRYNKQLQKHFETVHGDDKDNRIYSCDSCPYTTIYVGQLWEHVLEKHPGKDKDFAPKNSKDALFNLLAEQNMVLMEEVRNMRTGMKDSFNQLAGDFDKTINEVNEKAEERDKENKEIIRKLCEKVERLERSVQTPSTSPPYAQPPPVPSSVQEKRDISHKKQKTAYQSRKKVLYVADSVGRNLKFPKIEADTKCVIKTAKAYSAAYDKNAKWPESNFSEVVNQELIEKSYDTIVMTAPTVDITNLDTSSLKEEDNTEVYQQVVFVSCQNMFNTAHRAINTQESLEKVILMEHPPRYDSKELDPIGLKPKLAKLANSMYNQLWLDSPYKNKIIIGNHSLETNGSGEKHAALFTNIKTGMYDGVHHHGGMGRALYSESVKRVFKNTVQDQNTKIIQEAPLPKHYHQELCPQAIYQKKQTLAHSRYHPSVQDRNRFSVFNSNQGNL